MVVASTFPLVVTMRVAISTKVNSATRLLTPLSGERSGIEKSRREVHDKPCISGLTFLLLSVCQAPSDRILL